MPCSANVVSLFEAQQNFQSYGASERHKQGHTRDPVEDETVEPGWRPLDPDWDNLERPGCGTRYGDPYPWPDTTVLYYWRPTYWRCLVG